jgi:glycosyltransferase involved in cell wall biosynthesis
VTPQAMTDTPSTQSSHGDSRIRLAYIVSAPVPCAAYPWIAAGLDRERFDLSFLLLNIGPAPMEQMIRAQGVPVVYIPLDGRFGVARATRAVAAFCRRQSIDVAHVHMERASLPGLLGVRLAGVPVRIHTRHIAGPYPESYRKSRDMLKDRRNNWLSTHIVAPSETTRQTLLNVDAVPASKITVIPHGFDMTALGSAGPSDAARMRAKYGFEVDAPVIGVVSRYLAIKGIDDIIAAFRKLLGSYPRARLVLANARGRQEDAVRSRLRAEIPGRYTEIVYETDMPALYRTFDVFVHVPVEPHYESFGQVYVEALACGVPSVFTIAGVAGDFVRDGENALVVPSRSPDKIHEAILRLLADPDLSTRLAANGRRDVEERYDLSRMLRPLEELYLRLHLARGGIAS